MIATQEAEALLVARVLLNPSVRESIRMAALREPVQELLELVADFGIAIQASETVAAFAYSVNATPEALAIAQGIDALPLSDVLHADPVELLRHLDAWVVEHLARVIVRPQPIERYAGEGTNVLRLEGSQARRRPQPAPSPARRPRRVVSGW